MARVHTPVILAGIEFDALLDESKAMSSAIPSYPVEDGFNPSDTIINDPIQLAMTLLIADNPVTWRGRHGTGRVDSVCRQLENLWSSKQLVKVVTNNAIYTNMGITELKISHSQGDYDTVKVELTVKKVNVTQRSTTAIPATSLKSGSTKASGGKASTSNAGTIKDAATPKSGSSSGGSSSSSSSSSSGSSSSVLYGVMYGSSSSSSQQTTSRRISGQMEY